MNRFLNRTSYEELIDTELPSSGETLDHFHGDTTTVPHHPVVDILPCEAEEEGDRALIDSWQDTHRESDLITFPRTVCQSSSVSTGLSHSPQRQQSFSSQFSVSAVLNGAPVRSDGCSATSVLKQTRPPHVMPSPSDRVNRGFLACSQRIERYLACSPRPAFSHRQPRLVNMEGGTFWEATSATDTLQSSSENHDPAIFETSDIMTDDETEDPECRGASAAEVSEELVCRIRQRISEEDDNECRHCYGSESSPSNPLLSPCLCSGSLKFIHRDCLKKWIQARIELERQRQPSFSLEFAAFLGPVLTWKITSLLPSWLLGSFLSFVRRCELCLGELTLHQDVYDLYDCYMRQGRGTTGIAEMLLDYI